jgi:hypothetical protein
VVLSTGQVEAAQPGVGLVQAALQQVPCRFAAQIIPLSQPLSRGVEVATRAKPRKSRCRHIRVARHKFLAHLGARTQLTPLARLRETFLPLVTEVVIRAVAVAARMEVLLAIT